MTGSAPNRIFNIEWRTVYFNDTTATANYELRLYEGQTRFDVVWGNVDRVTAQPQLECSRTIAPSTSTFCDGSGGADYGRTKLHPANLRNADANTHC